MQKKDDYYEIIAGERRWRAAKLAGIKEVPVIIKDFTEQEVVEISLIENIQRESLNPIEEAHAYKRLMEEFHLRQDEIAERVSKSRTAVTNSMRLLKLDDRVQQMVVDEMLTTGHVRTLLALENKELQYNTAMKIFDEKLSVRETERLVKEILNPKVKKEKKSIWKRKPSTKVWKRKSRASLVRRFPFTAGQSTKERSRSSIIPRKSSRESWICLNQYSKR